MSSPALFGPEFPSPDWDAWRAVAAALFGLPMTEDQLSLFRQCTGRTTPPTKPFREAALICGRRAGKSRALALLAVFIACFRDHSQYLAAGECGTIAVICPSRKQSSNVLRYVVGLLRLVPALSKLIVAETTEGVTLSNRVVIEVFTASYRVTRGFTLLACLCDESAFWPDDASATPDVEIVRALKPSLKTTKGLLVLASSPYSKRGLLWDYYQRHFGRDDSDVLVWKAPTWVMHPAIDRAEIEAEREADPEYVQGEFDAEFRDDTAAFLDEALLRSAVDDGVAVRPPKPGTEYFMFVDSSGGRNDSFCAAVAHLDGDIAIIDALYECRAPFNPLMAIHEAARLAHSYRIAIIEGDDYAADLLSAMVAKEGIRYERVKRDRSEMYLEAAVLFTSGRARLVDNPRAVRQLARLSRRSMANGRDK